MGDSERTKKSLHEAARENDIESIKILLERSHPDMRDSSGKTPLHEACLKGHVAAVELLLNSGAKVDARRPNGFTPLHYVAANGHKDVCSVLLAHGAECTVPDRLGDTPFHMACRHGFLSVVKLFCTFQSTCGGSGTTLTSLRNCSGRTALHSAALSGHADVIKALVEAGADVSVVDRGQCRPVHDAAAGGHVAAMEALAVAGADFNVQDTAGLTALHRAAAGGHVAAVEWLLNPIRGVKPCPRDANDSSPLYWAASRGHSNVVRVLLGMPGYSARDKNKHRSALEVAAGWGHNDVCAVLLECGESDEKIIRQGDGSQMLCSCT